ncbi:hypothetical protein ACF3NX_06395 [Acetobacter orientalis]|uniref:gp53-like domain-containing protein n=1 Tax=Acetobacter orientalis TaxID=146474 RepID=UPI003869E314
MKKVETNNGVWVNDDPATLTNGTPIDADVMNNIQDEISNVITDNGGTLDGTNHSQLSQTLNKNFAKLNSPTLTGIPLTSNPDGTINNQIATVDYVNQKALQATVGFTPVQQSGGDNQGANKIYIGADKTDSNQIRVQVDQTDLGKIVFQEEDYITYGISKIGYNHGSDTLAYYDTGNKAWHFSYTTEQIDAKQWISSLPDGNNLKVSDIIWNSSSSLPALYYGTDNSVAYLATEAWADGQFLSLSNSETQTVEGPVTYKSQTSYENTLLVTGNEPTIHFTRTGVNQWDTWVGADGTLYIRKFDADGNWIEDYSRFKPNGSIEFTKPVTLSGGAQVPDITDFAGQSVLNAKTAENRYAKLAGGNTFTGNQTFNGFVTLANAVPLQTVGGTGGVIVNWYADASGVASIDLNNSATSANISWFKLYQNGRVGTNIGDVTFNSDFNFNKNTNGYIILPTGLIIQWGIVNPSGGTYNFPITFPNAVFNVVSGNCDYQGQYADTAYTWAVSTSQFRAGTKAVNTGWATGFSVAWVAFGF